MRENSLSGFRFGFDFQQLTRRDGGNGLEVVRDAVVVDDDGRREGGERRA